MSPPQYHVVTVKHDSDVEKEINKQTAAGCELVTVYYAAQPLALRHVLVFRRAPPAG
jgi:hypothetical protein